MNLQSIPTHTVDPERLSTGQWSNKHNRQVDEGDISASYSADTIALHNRIRKPFLFQNKLWISVGSGNLPVVTVRAYQLLDANYFDGVAATYAEKTRDSEAARNDPSGFYHGMIVTHAGRLYALVGPAVQLIAGEQRQADLFG